MGKISTETMLLIGGGALLAYFILKPKTTTILPSGTILPGTVAPSGPTAAQASEVNTAITQGASTIQDLFNNLLG